MQQHEHVEDTRIYRYLKFYKAIPRTVTSAGYVVDVPIITRTDARIRISWQGDFPMTVLMTVLLVIKRDGNYSHRRLVRTDVLTLLGGLLRDILRDVDENFDAYEERTKPPINQNHELN